MKMRRGGGVMFPQAKEHQTWPANHEKLGERHRTGSLTALGRNQPADTLMWGFLPLELWDYQFLLFKPPRVQFLLRQPGESNTLPLPLPLSLGRAPERSPL